MPPGVLDDIGEHPAVLACELGAVAIGNQQRHAQFARGVDHGLLVQPVVIQSAAAAQLALQSRLTVTRHAPASPKNFTTSSIRRIVSA
ncbi:Uncharacterised protein [Bordetella pertussis]|nr:Uncharacterised protein [Bordetella pertussis]